MINDDTALAEIRKDWGGVEALKGKLYLSSMVSGARGHFPFALANAAHNLPFLHACCVLDDVLKAIEKEEHFTADRKTLGGRIYGSEQSINWVNFPIIKKILTKRNGLAHKGEILERGECWEYIDALKIELLAWNILTP